MYVASALLPSESGTFGLLDILNIVSLLSVILIVAGSLLVYRLHNGEEEHSPFILSFDRMLLITISMGYLLVSIVLPLCAF